VRLVSALEIDRAISADVIGERVDDLLMDQACRAGDVDQSVDTIQGMGRGCAVRGVRAEECNARTCTPSWSSPGRTASSVRRSCCSRGFVRLECVKQYKLGPGEQ
jgi:hypothetical protein